MSLSYSVLCMNLSEDTHHHHQPLDEAILSRLYLGYGGITQQQQQLSDQTAADEERDFYMHRGALGCSKHLVVSDGCLEIFLRCIFSASLTIL